MSWRPRCAWCGSEDLEERPSVERLDGEEIHFTHRCRKCSRDLVVTKPDLETIVHMEEPAAVS